MYCANVSSSSSSARYSRSKLHNLLFALELQRRLRAPVNAKGSLARAGPHAASIVVNAVHPGSVVTNVMRDMHPLIVAGYQASKSLGLIYLTMKVSGGVCVVWCCVVLCVCVLCYRLYCASDVGVHFTSLPIFLSSF